jgi:hypothetical protein
VNIENLLMSPSRRGMAAAPEADALVDPDALLEAALLDVRLDGTSAVAWLLFDCRGAVQIEMGNTAIVVVQGLTSLRWRSEPSQHRTWRAVVDWMPVVSHGRLSISADLSPSGHLETVGTAGEFYVGDIPGGDEPPPNFLSATEEEIRSGLARWTSEFDVVHASFLDA